MCPLLLLLDQQEQGDDWQYLLTLENKDMAGVTQSIVKKLNI